MHPSFKFITFTLTATLLIQALFPLGIQAAKSGPTCYFPDGTSALEDEDEALLWEPCNQVVGSVGPCCQTNHTTWTTGAKPDVCQPNGLCSNWWYPDDGDPYVAWWAPICTDKDWNSPNCVKLPVDKCGEWGINKDDDQERRALAKCSDDTWCCMMPELDDFDCCEIESMLFQLPNITWDASTTTSSTASSTSSSPTNIIPPTAIPIPSIIQETNDTSDPDTDEDAEEAVSDGTWAAVAVAIVMGTIILSVGVVWVLKTSGRLACWGREPPHQKKPLEVAELGTVTGTSMIEVRHPSTMTVATAMSYGSSVSDNGKSVSKGVGIHDSTSTVGIQVGSKGEGEELGVGTDHVYDGGQPGSSRRASRIQ